MKLFDSDKDWILKVTNLVLLVWLISAITFFQISVVDIAIPDYERSYKEYEISYCQRLSKEDYGDDDCLNEYKQSQLYTKERAVRKKISVFTSLGNIIIVSLGIYLLNKNKN